jgi:hypothetical protein
VANPNASRPTVVLITERPEIDIISKRVRALAHGTFKAIALARQLSGRAPVTRWLQDRTVSPILSGSCSASWSQSVSCVSFNPSLCT